MVPRRGRGQGRSDGGEPSPPTPNLVSAAGSCPQAEASWLRLWSRGHPRDLRLSRFGGPAACSRSLASDPPHSSPHLPSSTGHPQSRPQGPPRWWHFTVQGEHILASVMFTIVVKSTYRRIYHPNPFAVYTQPCKGHLHCSGLFLKISRKRSRPDKQLFLLLPAPAAPSPLSGSMVLILWVLCVSTCIFCAWLSSLSILSSRFAHVARVRIRFLSKAA